ncbi:isocitrate lyase/phosphoenolpyruvate mutase family protein [Microlunatus phosphovorus]|uniref:isocitrate lyase/phosphoenolpyruvate mutase family protein n=1 Tax=Microlunatus phosphovorus TaxID=29405 RepID=UPI0018D2D6AC
MQRVRAACEARRDADLVIIARTDAYLVEGLERTIERGHAYLGAGRTWYSSKHPGLWRTCRRSAVSGREKLNGDGHGVDRWRP